jgi:putative peptide zinc metalloprotease protein
MNVIAPRSRVQLHRLHMRKDGNEWIVGRKRTGEFISVPTVAVELIRRMDGNHTLADVEKAVAAGAGVRVDVTQFVEELQDLGFIRSIDGRVVRNNEPPVSLTWLKPRHMQWVWNPNVWLAYLIVVASAAVVCALVPSTLPRHADLLWSSHVSVTVLGNFVLGWTLLYLHELGHLGAARACGVPGRISLGTRLQFLVAQTDVSGMWAVGLRRRVVVYLAGTIVDIGILATALLVRFTTDPHSVSHALSGAVVVIVVSAIPFQLLVFMRTDLFFVLQDYLRCRNLFDDGSAYSKWLAHRLVCVLRRQPPQRSDPSKSLPVNEQTAIRYYALLLALGVPVCLGAGLYFTLPFLVSLAEQTLENFWSGNSTMERVDALLTAAAGLFGVALWARVWARNHTARIQKVWTKLSKTYSK